MIQEASFIQKTNIEKASSDTFIHNNEILVLHVLTFEFCISQQYTYESDNVIKCNIYNYLKLRADDIYPHITLVSSTFT